MIKRTLEQIAMMCGGTLQEKTDSATVIQGVSTDTRTMQPGCLYVPLTGEKYDGHQYADEAAGKGAAAALWQQGRSGSPEGLPIIEVADPLAALQQLSREYRIQLPVRVIGITGSNGKTTTKDMIASILETTYKVHKTKGNLNNHIGLPLTLLQMDEDTEMAVIEMGMSGRGEISFLSLLALPEVAVITNVGESHLLQLGSRQEIARAKLEILDGLKDGGLIVYNGDEPLITAELEENKQISNVLQYRFGKNESNDAYPSQIVQDGIVTSFRIGRGDALDYRIPLLGKHNVINAIAAIVTTRYMGVHAPDVLAGLKQLQVTSMRIERIVCQSGAVILNDAYNASPTSMKAAIALLVELSGFNRKIAVLGDMLELGPTEKEYHQEIGRLLQADQVDLIYTFGDLGRHISQAAEAAYSNHNVRWFANKQELIDELLTVVGHGDVVLVKGSRGMKLEEVVHALVASAGGAK